MGMEVPLQDTDLISFGYIPEGIFILFSAMALPVCIPTNSAQGFPFLCILTNMYLLAF